MKHPKWVWSHFPPDLSSFRLPLLTSVFHGPRWGIVPLGTGNDFSRVAGWGAPCDDFLMRGTHDLWDRFMGTVQSGPGGNNPEGVDANDFELLKDLVTWPCRLSVLNRAEVSSHGTWRDWV